MNNSSNAALERLWLSLCRQQQLQRRAAMKRADRPGISLLREKIPDSTREDLDWAFGLAFGLVFQQGETIIKKSYSSEKLARKCIARDLAMNADNQREAQRYFEAAGRASGTGNMIFTTIEGMGLGALGVGLPDIVLFVAMLLRGVYETALEYGYGCDSNEDKMYILRLLECSMLSGKEWLEADAQVEAMGSQEQSITRPQLREQMQRTAAAFSTDLLVLKFIQGLPLVGILGGLGNPVYYRRVLNYAQLKYQRRYIKSALDRKKDIEE